MKKRSYLFLFSLIIIILVCVGLLKNNHHVIKTDYSKLKLVLTCENVVDKDLIDYLSSVNGKASLFTQSKQVSYVEDSSKKKKKVDVDVKVNAEASSFPKDTEIKVENVSVNKDKVKRTLKNYSKDIKMNGLYAVDISFYSDGIEQQPKDEVLLTIELPEELDYSDSNTLVLLHFDKDNIEVIGSKSIVSKERSQLSFKVDSFSTYAVVLAESNYSSNLMRDVLIDNEDYEIVTFKTNLFKYDPIVFNQAGTGERIMFRPYDGSTNEDITGTNGVNNDTSSFAKQSIVSSNLDSNGMPSFNYSSTTGSVFFDPNYEYDGKTSYKDVDFEFIYNKKTGYYEYRSSLNHAQYNPTTNKIELYADTLAPDNLIHYVPTRIDLSKYNEELNNDINSVSTNNATGQLIGTARDIDGDGNVIPKLVYPINFSSIDVKQINFDVYLPQVKEPNAFRIYFTTDDVTVVNNDVFDENKCYTIEYDGNGVNDTYYMNFNTFDNPNWRGNITGIMISPYEIYSTDRSYDFRMDDISFMRNDGYSESYAGFYPFAKVENSTVGTGNPFSLDSWVSSMEKEPTSVVSSSRMIDSETLDINGEYLRFGYTTSFDFYIPKNRTLTGENDDASTIDDNLRFEFSGDDDLWVFIDDKLVLDVGGGHNIIDGYIDLTANQVYVSNALRVIGYNNMEDINSVRPSQSNIDNNVLTEGKHTIKIFSLERTGNYSNNIMRFNLPQKPIGDVIVSKQAIDDSLDSTFNNVDFEFTIESDGSLINNLQYTVIGEGITYPENKTVSNGKFTLKNNQYAIFSNVEDNKSITITEVKSNVDNYENYFTSINGEETKTLTQTSSSDTSLEFNVINRYRTDTTDINYVIVIDPKYKGSAKGIITLNGSSKSSNEILTESLVGSNGNPTGVNASTSGNSLSFVGWYSDPECNNLISSNTYFMPPRPNEGYSDASYYACFAPNFGDLTIQKKVDNKYFLDSKFLFKIVGTSDDTKDINMTVSLSENSSVTIKNLPVGTYTITEDTNWNWRYTVINNPSVNITLNKGENNVLFDNSLTNEKWVSFDTYVINEFSY